VGVVFDGETAPKPFDIIFDFTLALLFSISLEKVGSIVYSKPKLLGQSRVG